MREAQVAVVGAGPAGLSAAAAAARSGARVVLLDEQPVPGGQLRYRIAALAVGPDHGGPVRPAALSTDLISRATDAGVDIRSRVLAWGLFGDNVLGILEGEDSFPLRAERIVLATGSTDRPLPFPGGTLPGVFSARAVQLLLHVHRVRPGRRFVVVGDGAEAAEVGEDIALAGGEVVARVSETASAGLVAEGTTGVETVAVEGRRQAAEVVVVAVGRQPDPQLALMAGCAAGHSAELGGFVPIRDADLRTSVPGIFVCGDGAGICDVPTALAEGRLAGLAAAASLGLAPATEVAPARDALGRLAPDRLTAAARLTPTYAQV